MERGSGIIMHIASLPGRYGIGTFGKEAYEFADFLKKAGQSFWQILPLGQTSYGDSPYQSFSAFAGNPYFIDFDILESENLIRKSDYDEINFGDNPERINYELLFKEKLKVLKLAYENFKQKQCEDFKNFEKEEDMWLDDYATFMALKNKFDLKSFQTWDDDIKLRKNDVLKNYKEELKDEIKYWKFVQYEFFKQWTNFEKLC